MTTVHQQFAQPVLAAERIMHPSRRNIATFDQDFAEAWRRVARVMHEFAGNVRDVDVADILDKDEDVLDRIETRRGGQQNVPGEMAVLRFGLLQRGNLIDMGDHRAFAQTAQLVEQQRGFGAAEEQWRLRGEADAIDDRDAAR